MNKAGKLAGEWGPGVFLTLGTLWVLQGALTLVPKRNVVIQGLNDSAGLVKSGAVISHNVRIINLSQHPVEVEAQAGCGCTVAETPEKAIPPLHSGFVKLRINTNGLKAGGFYKKEVTIQLFSGEKIWQQTAIVSFKLT